jgi:hypothetical protein
LDVRQQWVRLVTRPWPDIIDQCADLEAMTAARGDRLQPLTTILTPTHAMLINTFARAELRNRLLLTAAALERYRRQHGVRRTGLMT